MWVSCFPRTARQFVEWRAARAPQMKTRRRTLRETRGFARWMWRVVKAWFWALGFIPVALDYITAYVPSQYVPAFVSSRLDKGASWLVTLTFVVIGLLISTYLVHARTERRLSEYEYQAPDYELQAVSVDSELCKPPVHVHTRCHFRMKGLTPWPGELAGIIIQTESKAPGLGDWTFHDIGRWSGERYDGPLRKWPIVVPPAGSGFLVRLRSPITDLPGTEQRCEWEHVRIAILLRVEYFTQPVGDVRRLFRLDIEANLGEEFDTLVGAERRGDAGGD